MTVVWDRKGFDEFEAGLKPARLKLDKVHMRSIFNVASRVPMLKQALVWAKENDIRFFVDHTCKNIGGYYVPGAGVVAIAKDALSFLPFAAGVIVHEVAHAWQDKNDMLPSAQHKFIDAYVNRCLIEAHSTTLQRVTEGQTALLLPHMEEAQKLFSLNDKTPWQHCTEWFTGPLPVIYGTSLARERGHEFGFDGVYPEELCFEFGAAAEECPPSKGINVYDQKDIWRLSSDFNGQPLFDPVAGPDFIDYVTDPAIAMRFYQRYLMSPPALVQRVCQAEWNARLGAAGP